jgi:hypothetical protein
MTRCQSDVQIRLPNNARAADWFVAFGSSLAADAQAVRRHRLSERLTHERWLEQCGARARGLALDALDGRRSVIEVARLIVRENALADEADPVWAALALVESETEGLPVTPEEWSQWHPDVISEKRAEVARAESWARETALDALRALVASRPGAA